MVIQRQTIEPPYRRAIDSSYQPGTGQLLNSELSRLERQAELTFETEFGLMVDNGLTSEGTVVDMGSGSGAVTRRLRARLPGATVIAADVDLDLLRSIASPTTPILHGRTSLESGTVDDVVLRFVAQHLTLGVRANVWAEALRILRPGGRLFVIDVDDNESGEVRPACVGLAPVFRKLNRDQREHGGDRQVIRKIADELAVAGFSAATRLRGEVTSETKPIDDFGVHLGPDRHLGPVASGVLTLADLALVTRAWEIVRADPDAWVSVKVHLVKAVKSDDVNEGESR